MDAAAPSSNAPDQPEAADLPCPFCGYNLHGITSPRCPECGGDIDYAALSQAHIPWEHRRQIGSWRAYWRTVVGFTFKPARWATARATPSYADAVRFRALTVGVAFGVILLGVVGCRVCIKLPDASNDRWAFYELFDPEYIDETLLGLFRSPVSLSVSLVAIFLALIAITGMPVFFFRNSSMPISRQNRALALAQYTCAPLAWLPLTIALLAATLGFNAWLISEEIHWGVATALVVGAAGALVVQMFLWWLGTLRVLRASTEAGAGRMIACATLEPLACLLLVLLIPVVLDLVVSFVLVVVVSLFRY